MYASDYCIQCFSRLSQEHAKWYDQVTWAHENGHTYQFCRKLDYLPFIDICLYILQAFIPQLFIRVERPLDGKIKR